MKNISLKRMSAILRRDLVSNWKGHLRQFGVIYSMLVGLMCMQYYKYFNIDRFEFMGGFTNEYLKMGAVETAEAVSALSIAFIVYMLTTSFAGISSKQQRISALMLPATNLEKFITGITSALIKGVVFTIIAAILADLTRMAIMPAFHITMGTLIPEIFRQGFYNDVCLFIDSLNTCRTSFTNGQIYEVWAAWRWFDVFWGYFLGCAYAIFVSALFRKKAFLWGCLLFIVGVAAFVGVVYQLDEWGVFPHVSLTMNEVSIVWLIVATALIALMLYVSYRLFCRIQVIPRKWFSL